MAILAYDDVMLREPRLLVPGMQPLSRVTAAGSAGIEKPKVALVFSNGMRCVAGSPAYVVHSNPAISDLAANRRGIGLRIISTSSTETNAPQLYYSAPASDWTLLFDGIFSGTFGPTQNCYFLDAQTGRLVFGKDASSSDTKLGVYNGAAWVYSTIDMTGMLNNHVSICWSLNNAASTLSVAIKNWDSGFFAEEIVGSAYPTQRAITATVRLMGRFADAAGSYTFAGHAINGLMLWAKAMPIALVKSLVLDPYQVIAPA